MPPITPTSTLAELAEFLVSSGASPGIIQIGPAIGTTSPQLQAFLQAIPFANDGDVITPDHHNTLRAAIGQIARSLDEAQFARVVTKSFTPALLPVAGSGAGAWRTRPGVAVGPDTGQTDAEGWLPLDLPNGTDIDSLTVRGATAADVGLWAVSLRRLELTSAVQTDVCIKEIQGDANAAHAGFAVSVPVAAEGLSPAQASELRRVDNEKYQYAFHTEFNTAEQPAAVELRAVQVTCTRG